MPLAPGGRVDAYELLRPIGRGGMGEVWLATEVHLRRKVALKLLPPDLTRDTTRVRRFQQEARAASALNHPNVCVIHALGTTADGQHYIAMEHVEGRTLRARLVGERLTIREALDIGIQIASALAAAHASGIVHRDIKPENVMLRPDGFVKVLDFGLAKLTLPAESDVTEVTQTAFRTEAGSIVGTVAYMSPEQARGQPMDARTDIWSLGVLLYEMVAGRSPFPGQSSSDVLAAILQNEPLPVARFDPAAPAEVQRIITKTLRKDRSQRYQSVQDLLLDLQTLREEIQSQARPGNTPGTPITTEPVASGFSQTVPSVPSRRRRAGLIAAAIVLVLCAVLGVWALRTTRPEQTPAAPTGPLVQRNLTRLTFGPGLQTDVTWSPDGNRIAYASDRSGNFDIWSQAVSGGEPVQITKSPAPDTQPAWSPDGQNIAFRREGEGLFVVPALRGGARQLSSFGDYPQWSPDGAAIMFHVGEPGFLARVYRVSADGGEPPRESLQNFLRGGLWDWMAFHPDGRISALGIQRQTGFGFFTVSAEDGHVTTSPIAPGLPLAGRAMGTRVLRFQWNATGDALFVEAMVNEVRNVWKIRVDPRTLAWLSAERLTTGIGADVAVALSSDGTRLAFTARRESVRLWVFPFDAAAGRVTGEGRPVSPEEGGAQRGGDISPDGRRIAYGLTRAGSDRVDLWLTEIESGASELLAQNALGPSWSPDGKMIAYNLFRRDRKPPGEWALAVRELGGAERILGGWSTKSVLLPSDWTRDGRAILGVYLSPLYTGMARLERWPVGKLAATAPERVLVQDTQAKIWQGRYSPDGRWLSFLAVRDEPPRSQIAVVPAAGAPRDEWTWITAEDEWTDKPRWAPDGRAIYFLSKQDTSFFNLRGIRFDPERGKPIGQPFSVTFFDAPSRMISQDVANTEIDISARRAMLTMTTATGNIWMLDNADK